MKRLFLISACAIVCLSAPATAGPQEDAEAVLHAWAAAFAARDGEKSAAVYAPDARLWGTVSAKQTVGREAIRDYFQRNVPNVQSRTVTIGERATRVYGNTAVTSGHYVFRSVALNGTQNESPSRFSMTIVNHDGRWMIVDHHSSRLPKAP
jgi:uncharacterized protein (TIGR02246 family)